MGRYHSYPSGHLQLHLVFRGRAGHGRELERGELVKGERLDVLHVRTHEQGEEVVV